LFVGTKDALICMIGERFQFKIDKVLYYEMTQVNCVISDLTKHVFSRLDVSSTVSLRAPRHGSKLQRQRLEQHTLEEIGRRRDPLASTHCSMQWLGR
jgi:hypothetical protein